MTRREWLLIAHTMREERDRLARAIRDGNDGPDTFENVGRRNSRFAGIEDSARALADAIDKYEREPSDRWLRRHPGEPPENYRSPFDKARFLQECGLGTEPETGL